MSHKQSPKAFWSKVVKQEHGCWEWQGSCNNSGYGTCGWGGKTYVAHRVAAWIAGMIDDMAAPKNADNPTHVLHKCDNRKCCNPEHFFLGTFSDNQLDAYNKKRKVQPKGEAHANAKLSNAQAEEVRVLYTEGWTQVRLALRFGISQTAISRIIRNIGYI